MQWGLIGASTIASQHMINAIRSQDGNRIASVLSSSAERGRDFADVHGIPAHTAELDDILSNPEIGAVYISTTNEKHCPQALAAIAAGKHVLCEKPLAMSVADAVEMVRAAEAAGVVFATNHHLRNAGSHLKMKELIGAGRIGQVQAIRIFHAVYLPENLQGWRINDAAAGGGVIPDIVVHDADTVRFHLDEDPVDVVAIERAESLGQGVEDSVMSVWSMPSGIMVQTHEGFTVRHAGTGFEVHGTEGSIIARNVMTQQPIGTITLRDASGEQPAGFSDHNLYGRSLGLFMGAVHGAGQPSATGIDGVKSLAVADAVKKAATSGQRTRVDYGGL
jgi:1,5-anhydro-D-fructose reductase (1,5-anhydro-D-mannitol-forming)